MRMNDDDDGDDGDDGNDGDDYDAGGGGGGGDEDDEDGEWRCRWWCRSNAIFPQFDALFVPQEVLAPEWQS